MVDKKVEFKGPFGLDVLEWTVGEERSAVCAAPFTEDKGKMLALQKVFEGPTSSARGIKSLLRTRFTKNSFTVKPDDFAKVNCWIAKADLKYGGKDVHCDGIDIEGKAINPLAVADNVGSAAIDAAKKISTEMEKKTLSKKLAQVCYDVLVANKDDDPKLHLTQDQIKSREYP